MNVANNQQCAHGRAWRQGGAYAMEFALVLPVMFVLSYAVMAFGLMFFMKQNLQFAAEQGARAALVYQTTTASRLSAATNATSAYLSGTMKGFIPPTATLCKVGDACDPANPPANCGNTVTDACLVNVVARYDVRKTDAPLFASLPGLGFFLPTPFVLQGSATALINGSSL